jgi:hypothetical protein
MLPIHGYCRRHQPRGKEAVVSRKTPFPVAGMWPADGAKVRINGKMCVLISIVGIHFILVFCGTVSL